MISTSLIVSLILVWVLFNSDSSSNKDSKYSAAVLQINADWHIQRAEIEAYYADRKRARRIKQDDMEYFSIVALSVWQAQGDAYFKLKDQIDAIPPDEIVDVWLPKWIDYVCDWNLDESINEYERDYGSMSFKVFIASEHMTGKWMIAVARTLHVRRIKFYS